MAAERTRPHEIRTRLDLAQRAFFNAADARPIELDRSEWR